MKKLVLIFGFLLVFAFTSYGSPTLGDLAWHSCGDEIFEVYLGGNSADNGVLLDCLEDSIENEEWNTQNWTCEGYWYSYAYILVNYVQTAVGGCCGNYQDGDGPCPGETEACCSCFVYGPHWVRYLSILSDSETAYENEGCEWEPIYWESFQDALEMGSQWCEDDPEDLDCP
jgi:hypothetical protein